MLLFRSCYNSNPTIQSLQSRCCFSENGLQMLLFREWSPDVAFQSLLSRCCNIVKGMDHSRCYNSEIRLFKDEISENGLQILLFRCCFSGPAIIQILLFRACYPDVAFQRTVSRYCFSENGLQMLLFWSCYLETVIQIMQYRQRNGSLQML